MVKAGEVKKIGRGKYQVECEPDTFEHPLHPPPLQTHKHDNDNECEDVREVRGDEVSDTSDDEFDPGFPDILARCGMTRIYDLAAWDRLRTAKLTDQPLCEACLRREVIEIAGYRRPHLNSGFEKRKGAGESRSRRSNQTHVPCVKPAITQRPMPVDPSQRKRLQAWR